MLFVSQITIKIDVVLLPIQLIVCNAPQHLQCVASATQFHKLFHYGHPVVFPVGSPEGCPVVSPDGGVWFGSVFFFKNL